MITMYVVGFNRGHHWRLGGIFGHGPIVAREAAVQGNDVRFIASEAAILRAPGSFDGDTLTRTMSPTSRHTSIRSIRRSVRWFALKEYIGGALWVLPSVAALLALAAGYAVSQIEVPSGSPLNWLAFQGTADDARALLITVSSTVVTVIALVLDLTVVALQLSSTQFSPRLLRNFLRDRATQVVLSTFIATFVYSAAGLFTVGLDAGTRTEVYPRLAVSGAIVLLFLSLGMVVYFAITWPTRFRSMPSFAELSATLGVRLPTRTRQTLKRSLQLFRSGRCRSWVEGPVTYRPSILCYCFLW
jgi:hypothetical protein